MTEPLGGTVRLPYVGMGPCAFCGDPDAGHRVRDAIAERHRAGGSLESEARDYDLTVEQVKALIAISDAEAAQSSRPE